VGITDRIIDVAAFTLGTASDAQLGRMAASQMLKLLMDLDGSRICELGSGQVIIRHVEEIPAGTSFRTYTTDTQATARILEGSDREDPDYIRTRVIITGAQVIEGAEPDTTSRTITATATLVGSPLVQPPLPSGSYIDGEEGSHLIDTDTLAATLAGLYLTRYARIPRYASIEIAGDPQLELGQTLTLSFPELDLSGRFFVSGIEHNVDRTGYVTRLDLRGGDELGGEVNINPIAAFTYTAEREVMGNAVYTVVTFDASGSFDPDGGAVSYAWSDNQSTTPEIATLSDPIITVRADTSGWSGDWEVTLTVTDSAGLTSTVTLTIPYSAEASAVWIPAIYAALGNNASATPDGGINWNDLVDGTCVSVDCKPADAVTVGVACFGYTNGAIKKTTDFCVSALTTVLAAAGANGTINHIWWDKNLPTRVWACTSTGRLLRSDSDGANGTWVVHKDFGNTYPLNRIATPAPQGVWVFGGRADVPSTLIQFEAVVGSGIWTSLTLGGELSTDLVGASSSATVAEAAHRVGDDLCIIFKGALLPGGVNLFYTATALDGGAGWKRATGLDASLSDGRFVVPDALPATFYANFGNRDIWATANGIAWTKTADVLPAGVTANHCLFFGDFVYGIAGVYLLACENAGTTLGIYKSTDGLVTVQALRPATGYKAWPTGATGEQIAIGPSGMTIPGGSIIPPVAYLQGGAGGTPNDSTPDLAYQNPPAGWLTTALPAILGAGPRPYTFSSTLWFVTDTSGFGNESTSSAVLRSTGGGPGAWATAPIGDETQVAPQKGGIAVMCKDAAGNIWGARQTGSNTGHPIATDIYKSPDNGATWGTSKKTVSTASAARSPLQIVAHPTNANIIALITCKWYDGDNRVIVWVTNNGGAIWTENAPTVASGNNFPIITNTASAIPRVIILQNGRFIAVASVKRGTTWTNEWWTSDNQGATWTQRKHVSEGTGSVPARWVFLAGQSSTGTKIVTVQLPIQTAVGLTPIVTVSTDFGLTWNDLAPSNDPTLRAANYKDAWYDQVNDVVYIFDLGTGVHERIFKLSPVTNAGAWQNVDNGCPTTGGGWRQAALIPGTYWA
jgi:hypothetical protein